MITEPHVARETIIFYIRTESNMLSQYGDIIPEEGPWRPAKWCSLRHGLTHRTTKHARAPGGRLHIKFARMCVLRIEKYTHFEGLLKN